MNPALDPELRRLAAASKRRKRLILAVIVGNALVALLLIGGPYLRGRHRALEGRQAFAEFAACLWGARPAPSPGLALPEGEEERFVDAFRYHEPGHGGGESPDRSEPREVRPSAPALAARAWPMHCAEELAAVAPSSAFWLFPDTRHAEGQVRRAVAMVRSELEDAARHLRRVGNARAEGVVPWRPRLASLRLQAALTLWSQEADVSLGLEKPMLTWPAHGPSTVRPERVPLRAAPNARVELLPRGDGLEVRALDSRGVSWVRVGGGRVDVRRLRRPRLVQGLGISSRWPLLVWSTPADRCVDGCARHSMGVAWLTDATAVTPEPVWLASHPQGPVENSVRALVDGTVMVVSATPDGSSELRTFARVLTPSSQDGSASVDGTEGLEDHPRTSDRQAPIAALGPHYVLPNGAIAALGTATAGQAPAASALEPGAARAAAEVGVASSDAAWGVVAAGWWSARATPRGVDVWRGASHHAEIAGAVEALRIASTTSEAPPGGDRAMATAEVAADPDTTAAILAIASERTRVFLCDDAGCELLGAIEDARDATVAVLGDLVVVPYRRGDDAQIRVSRFAARAADGPRVDGPAPAACTFERLVDSAARGAVDTSGGVAEGHHGFCGRPLVAARNGRVVLAAREGSDLWVLESREGMRWLPLRGLR